MTLTQIYYAGRTIQLPTTAARVDLDVRPSGTTHTTLTGLVERIMAPRVDIRVHMELQLQDLDDLTALMRVRAALHNWWQHASRGGVWAIAIDATRRVDTKLQVRVDIGGTSFNLASAADVLIGRTYKMFHGPNYQIVKVTNTETGERITVEDPLDGTFGTFTSVFRDIDYYFGQIRDPQAPIPIIDAEAPDHRAGVSPSRFRMVLDFFETFAGSLA